MNQVDVEEVRDTARAFVRKIGNRWNVPIPTVHLGDIADMAVAETMHVYTPEKGSVGNLLWYFCMGEIRKFIRFELRETASPLDVEIPETEVDYEAQYMAREVLEKLGEHISPKQLRVVVAVALDEDRRDVAKEMRTSRCQLDRLKYQVRGVIETTLGYTA